MPDYIRRGTCVGHLDGEEGGWVSCMRGARQGVNDVDIDANMHIDIKINIDMGWKKRGRVCM